MTRTYTRGALGALDPAQLGALLDGALGRTGTAVEVEGLAVRVTHVALSAGDDATVNAQIAAYVYDPLFALSAEGRTLRGTVTTLRQWAQDARDEVLAWDGQSQVQKNVALKVLVDRLGKLLDRMADVITVQRLNGP